jgi:endothelin-converting enzyme/putative endopeptidase
MMNLKPTLLLFFCFGITLLAQDKPLTILPYTPSLDTKFIDKSVDPCQNFYKYACGKWNGLNPIPPDQSRWDVYSKLADENAHYLWGILEQASKAGASRTPNEQKIGDFFAACMDEPAIERAALQPIESQLVQVAELKIAPDIAAFVAAEHRGGVDTNTLFDFSSQPDYDNSSQMIAATGAGGLGLPDRDYYTKTDARSQQIRAKYLEHVERMLQMIGESGPDAKADAQSVMRIETALATHSLTGVEKRDPYNLKHTYTVDQLRELTPAFDWDAYLAKSGAPAFEKLNVDEPKFLTELNRQLLSNKLSAWRAYFRWHIVHSYARFLPAQFQQENFAFYSKYLQGVPAMPPRWKQCERLEDHYLGEALGQVFVARTFAPSTKEEALKMTRQIEAEMGQDIHDLTWMSDTTKQQALLKLSSVVNKIGYPDRWRDYSSVTITPANFGADVLAVFGFASQRELNKIGKPVDRLEWYMSPPTINAYYDPQTNDINFPAGVLQPPLFDPKMDLAPNYGNTGATIGHELTHGFDDEGRQFDAAGNLKDWWTPADAKAFEQRVTCVRDQYAQYIAVDDTHINSSLTLGEDVADLGGTLLAYIAWKHAASQSQTPIDGYTPDQRFFIGMAQWACGDERIETKRMHVITDPHSPDEFRINGVVADLPQFGTAFGCKIGQPMMRENACRVC